MIIKYPLMHADGWSCHKTTQEVIIKNCSS